MWLTIHPHQPGMAQLHSETSGNTVLSPRMTGESQFSGSWLVFPTFREMDSDMTALLDHSLLFHFPLPRKLSNWTHVSLSSTEAGRTRQGGSEGPGGDSGMDTNEREFAFMFPFIVIVKSGSRGHQVHNPGLTRWESPGRWCVLRLGDLHRSESRFLTATKKAPSCPLWSWMLPDKAIPNALNDERLPRDPGMPLCVVGGVEVGMWVCAYTRIL